MQTGSIPVAILLSCNFFTIVHFKCIDIEIIWVVKIRKTSYAILRLYKTPFGHHTDRGPRALGQYNSLGDNCGLSTPIILEVCHSNLHAVVGPFGDFFHEVVVYLHQRLSEEVGALSTL